MYLFLIIYALLGMQLYAGEFNFRDNEVREHFDDFFFSFLSCFQLLTVENWNDILMNCFRTSINPFLTAFYLISWIFVGNFVFLNLFLAILIDGFCHTLDVDGEADDVTKNHDENFLDHAEHDVIYKNSQISEAKKNFERTKKL
jgi:Ion transport protein